MPREIINLYVGQCGNQISNQVIRQILQDNDFKEDGGKRPNWEPAQRVGIVGENCISSYGYQQLAISSLSDPSEPQAISRGIHIDTEPTVVDELLNSSLKNVINKNHYVTDLADAASNFGRGLQFAKKPFHKKVTDLIRMEVENCDGVCGFMPFYALGGGTGSGYMSELQKWLNDSYSKAKNITFKNKPSDGFSVTVEAMNACLAISANLEIGFKGVQLAFDNHSLYRLAHENLKLEDPTFANVNELIAALYSNIASYSEFNLHAFESNICPFKDINHLTCAVLPLKNRFKSRPPQDIWNLLVDSFAINHEYTSVDLTDGKYICANLFLKGRGNHPEVYGALNQINKFARFVSYIPTGFNVFTNDICYRPIDNGVIDTVTIMMSKISNHSAMGRVFEKLQEEMNVLLSQKAFVHHYFDYGMEIIDFKKANENITAMISTYDLILEEDIEGDEE